MQLQGKGCYCCPTWEGLRLACQHYTGGVTIAPGVDLISIIGANAEQLLHRSFLMLLWKQYLANLQQMEPKI